MDYGSHGITGPSDSPVKISCRVVAGDPPISERLPPFIERIGIDRSPIDLTNPDDARWLLACVWPDTDRLDRTAASIRMAQDEPPIVTAGDANEVLPAVLGGLESDTTALIVTTWAFAYFSVEDRQKFLKILGAESQKRHVAWLSAEGAGIVESFAGESVSDHDQAGWDVLGTVTFDGGEHRGQLLGFVQEHGSWIDWRAG
jgi:hypothetical protein